MRMRGPWAWDGAVSCMTDDLRETIARRKGMYGNFTMLVIPVVTLGLLQLCALVYATLYGWLSSLGLARLVKVVNQLKILTEALAKKKS
ncbi:hypothetical protein MMYC01_201099 [Madurella mycetomatis]|uniref:Uncharacterized protein n=1 Tax=Madurella mycetomatis TaxID=100816 RepID=A0A175WIE8_9PEZI|nr:hypothetical protein MMYC01_201099 [Madurella mycetomatis]